MIIILITILTLIYIHFGLLSFIQLLLWLIVIFSSNFILGINPEQKQYHISRITAIIAIMLVIYRNSIVVDVSTMVILPLSIKRITYLDDVKFSHIDSKREMLMLNLYDIDQISNFIKILDINYNYMLNIEFSPVITGYNFTDAPQLLLSRPIAINKFSSHTTIFEFINRRLEYMIDYYYLDDFILQQSNDGPCLILHFQKIYF